jgi:HD-GYP domain-containing protein (c-di-GMP phosphodiesterase class II)
MRGRRRFRLGCLPQQPILRTAIDRLGFIVQERQTINYHVSAMIRMLEQLPWPKHLKNVPDYAGGHHERTDGKGYRRGLTREQMNWQARMIGIADIF